jgi:hypothetical protein
VLPFRLDGLKRRSGRCSRNAEPITGEFATCRLVVANSSSRLDNPYSSMNKQTKDFITTDLLTISEVAELLHVPTTTAMKRSERNGWDYVLKGHQKLYFRGDFTSRFPTDQNH